MEWRETRLATQIRTSNPAKQFILFLIQADDNIRHADKHFSLSFSVLEMNRKDKPLGFSQADSFYHKITAN